MWRIKIIVTSIFLFTIFLSAQERVILRTNGEQIKVNNKKDLQEAIQESKLKRSDGKVFKNQIVSPILNAKGTIDTLSYRALGVTPNINFGFYSQDVMMMWFVASTDFTIKAIGFTCSDDSGYKDDGATVGLRLVKLNWSEEELREFTVDSQVGYYPSDGSGLSSADFFGEHASGNWIPTVNENKLPPWTDNADPLFNTFDYDLLSKDGDFFDVIPIKSNSYYTWLDISSTGMEEPEIKKGEVFAVVAKNNGVKLDSSRIGFWSDNTIGYPGWKFYANGRISPEEPGWWVRMYTWDFAVVAEMPCGIPQITITKPLVTTVSLLSQEVCAFVDIDRECLGISPENFNVNLVTVTNTMDTTYTLLNSTDEEFYCGNITVDGNCSEDIEYWVEALDSTSLIAKSISYLYHQFCVKDGVNLVVFNGYTKPTGYPQNYYWGTDTSYFYPWSYDVWSYGPLTKELVDNYKNIYEITTTGPADYNNEVIREWLEGDSERNYFLAGQEVLGIFSGFGDLDFAPGTFYRDILGITDSYNDVSYDGTSGQELPSKLIPVEESLFGGKVVDKFNSLISEGMVIDSLQYNPKDEINVNNWIDGFEVIEGDSCLEVFMKAETRGIQSAPEVREVNVGLNRVLPNGNHVVFMSYDPISVNTTPSYYWMGNSESSPQVSTLLWFSGELSSDCKTKSGIENGTDNFTFSLSQNYPNPFNPSTTINYSIPVVEASATNVVLKIYDILGREVTTLMDKAQRSGNYAIEFNGKELTSGIYLYRLTYGKYSESRKMILMK